VVSAGGLGELETERDGERFGYILRSILGAKSGQIVIVRRPRSPILRLPDMLPKNVTDLLDAFVRVFDSERPAVLEFRKAYNQLVPERAQQAWVRWDSGAIITIGIHVTAFLQDKAQFIWGKLQEIVSSTEIEAYPDLSKDLKSQIAASYNPTRQAAEQYIEELRKSENIPTGYTARTVVVFANNLSKINAEVDLFCVEYAANEKRRNQMNKVNPPTVIYNVSGHNARVNIGSADYSINIAKSEELFPEIRKTIENGIEDAELKHKLLMKTGELEANVGKSAYAKKYSDFVALAANHMTLLGPWIPALTKFLTP